MKRNASTLGNDSDSLDSCSPPFEDFKPDINVHVNTDTDVKPILKGSPKAKIELEHDAESHTGISPSPKKPRREKGSSGNGISNGSWTGLKRAQFLDEIIAVGYKHVDLDGLASKLEMSKRQLIDQLVPNRSNSRGKAVKAAGES